MRRIIFPINILFLAGTLVAWISIYVSPESFWPSGFFALTLPFLLITDFVFLLFWLLIRDFRKMAVSAAVLLLCYNEVDKMFSLSFSDQEPTDLKVGSANVRIFNVYAHLLEKDPEAPRKMINWIINSDFDVVALQEFYNEPGDIVFGSTRILSTKYPYRAVVPSAVNRIGAEFGIAIFSKHRILEKHIIKFPNSTHNQAMSVDVVYGGQIVRVFNIHLQSMHIDEGKILDGENDSESIETKGKYAIRRFRNGLKQRASQIDLIVKEIKSSPYPVIVCGDLNDTPFSYSYQQLNSALDNAFDEKGFGLGTTYNGRIPLLRIDNQFYSYQFDITSFTTHRDINYSDHYPITATYQLNK